MKRAKGYALIVVLWSIVILTIIFVNLIDEAQLNNLLIRNNLEQRELKQAAVDGIIKAIDLLERDQSKADTRAEKWAQPIQFSRRPNLNCQVKVTDIGSKLNINYTAQDDLLKLQNWDWEKVKWNKLADKLLWEEELSTPEAENKLGLIPYFSMLKAEFESTKDYQQSREFFTTYGAFNPNLHQEREFYKLLYFLKEKLDLYTLNQTVITKAGEKLAPTKGQASNRPEHFSTVKEFLKEAFPLNPELRTEIAPYLTVQKRININFVNQKVLQLILTKLHQDSLVSSPQDTAAKIIDYCKEDEIKKLSKVDQIGVGRISQELEPYLTTASSYLLIEAQAINEQTKRQQKVKAVVHKTRAEEKVEIQIINWQEE